MAKILIIDDDHETVKLFEAIAQLGGHETSVLHDSRNAAGSVAALKPDLILLDIMMPEINGLAVCKSIKSHPATSHIKVLMISALDDDSSKRDSANAGADRFITKPILPKVLLQQIEEVVAG